MKVSRSKYWLSVGGALALAVLSCGGAAAEPICNHGDRPGSGQHSGHDGHGRDHGHGGDHDHGHHGTGDDHGDDHGEHSPPGDNGTVKIAGPDDAVGHPSNNPHPGCTFFVEWFGFDAGEDVISTVTIAPQAPTSDASVSSTGPGQVFVGADDAGGGTDLDGRETYSLTFSGSAPQPQQGYHVKVTVATPHSRGDDTKTKVFWVKPCGTQTPPTTPTESPGETESASPSQTPSVTPSQTPSQSPTQTPAVASTASALPGTAASESPSSDQSVAGTSASIGDADVSAAATDEARTEASTAAVPTAVDAGSDAALPDWARSPYSLALAMAALIAAAVAVIARLRTRA